MKQVFLGFLAISLLTGCAQLGLKPLGKAGKPATVPTEAEPDAPSGDVIAVPGAARTVEEFDTTTSEQRAAAIKKAAVSEVDLGVTIASLGAATEPGFWLKTPLVTGPSKGRVVFPATGKSVQVDLIPIDGPKTAGSRMSLAALRLIEAPLTGLPEIRVYKAN